MKKAFFLIFPLAALLILADSKFNVVFFKKEPNLKSVVYCSVVDEIKSLKIALESKDPKTIRLNLVRLENRLNFAYNFETGVYGLRSNSKSAKNSDFSKKLDVARKEFGSLKKIDESDLQSKIPEIVISVRSAEDSLESYC